MTIYKENGNENKESPILEQFHNPMGIFNKNSREIIERNILFSVLFDDSQKFIDELFGKPGQQYDAFLHHVEADDPVTRIEMNWKSKDNKDMDLLISVSSLTSDEILLNITDITAWKNNERKAHIQRDLGLGLASCSSIHDALKLCYDAAIVVSDMECGGIYLIDKETEDFVLTYWKNVSDTFVKEEFRSPHGAKNTSLILKGKPIYSNYQEIQSSLNASAHKEGLRAIGLIPISHGGRVIGSFNIASRSMDSIPEYARDELEVIASQIGNVIVRIQAEEEMAQGRTDMQAFFDSIQDFIFVLSAEGQILQTNKEVSERLGYTPEELSRMNVLEVHPPERREEALAIVSDMIAGRRDFCPIPLYKKDGTLIPVETKVTPGHWGGKNVLFGLSRDITEREKAKDLLEKRDAILNAVSIAAHYYLKTTRWYDQIDAVLELFGQATRVDRVYLFQNRTDNDGILRCSQRFEWCAPGVEPQIDNPDLQDVNFKEAGFPRWIEIMGNGGVVSGDTDSFPQEEKELLHSQGIRSLVVVPVISDSRWWGYIGFDECKIEREWSPAEIDALHVAADILGSAIYNTMMEEVFKKPVEKSLVGTYLITDNTFEYINPRFAEIFGYSVEELMHIENIEQLIHPDDRPLFQKEVQKILSREVESDHNEFRGLTKSNETIFLEAYGSVVEFKGKSAIVGNIMDITERKHYENDLRESLDEKVVLLNEIHHRVKNNLQIISAFMKLQMMYMDDESGLQNLKNCDNQVMTMALIHESLYKSNDFTHIPLKDLVANMVDTIMLSYNGSSHCSYVVDVEDIILPIDTVMPCSLIITEFINFSQKYSPDIQEKAANEISIHQLPDSHILLTLKNTNIQLPTDIDLRSSDIIELEMIHTLVTNQLKGTVTLQTEKGTQLTIEFGEI